MSFGIPETFTDKFRDAIGEGIVEASMLKRAATLEDVARVAAFAASDRARMITGSTLNITGGATVD